MTLTTCGFLQSLLNRRLGQLPDPMRRRRFVECYMHRRARMGSFVITVKLKRSRAENSQSDTSTLMAGAWRRANIYIYIYIYIRSSTAIVHLIHFGEGYRYKVLLYFPGESSRRLFISTNKSAVSALNTWVLRPEAKTSDITIGAILMELNS